MDPKPISLTQVSEESYTGLTPQPFVVVGDIPGADFTPTEAPVINDEPADAGDVAADLQSLVDVLVQAGILTD